MDDNRKIAKVENKLDGMIRFEITEKHLDAALAAGTRESLKGFEDYYLSTPYKEALKEFDLIGDRQELKKKLSKFKKEVLTIYGLEQLYTKGLHEELREKLPFTFEWEEEKYQFTEEEELKLRHFDNKISGEGEQWLRNFCATNDCPSYETVIEAVTSGESSSRDEDGDYGWSHDGEYITFYGRDAHCDIPDEFWYHVEAVTGKKVEQHRRATHFSCSC